MFRILNATVFNSIANDPDIRPYLGGTEALDLTNVIANPNNYCFLTDNKNGAHLLINKGNGVYEVHTISLPEARGKTMLRLMKEARAFMFLQTDAVELQTFVPDGQLSTLLWADLAGFRKDYWRDNSFNGDTGGTYMSLAYKDWVLKDKDNLKIGKAFHDQIEKFELLTHEDDAVHDAWAGATVRSRALPKAISYYNQYAARTGYQTLSILSFFPYTVDLGNAVIQQNADNSISVLKVNNECLLEPLLVHLPLQV